MFKKIIIITLIVITSSIGAFILIRSIVIEKAKVMSFETGCMAVQTTEKEKCWESAMDYLISEKSIEDGFSLVEKWYDTDPYFVSNCHGVMHKLGESAYELYSRHKIFDLTNKTSYCGFGFYHSFMESLLRDGNELTKASEFCDYVGEKLGDMNDAKKSCFHGIGHGLADNHVIKSWNSESELVYKPLELCSKITSDELLIIRCASGVFNVMTIKYSDGGLRVDRNDPLRYCRSLGGYLKGTCYEAMNVTLMDLFKDDFMASARFIQEIKEDGFARSGIRGLMGAYASMYSSFQDPIQNCRSLQDRLKLSCIRGFVAGLIEVGKPGLEYVRALGFCGDNLLTQNEKDDCYQEVVLLSSAYYPKDKYDQICDLIKKESGQTCV